MAPLLNHENIGAVQKTAYLTATITSVDSANDTACFEGVGTCPVGVDTPIFYHCEPDSALRDNGALEGAAGAFSVDDEVIVQCEITGANRYVPLRVMGFTDKPKECGMWEPWTGPDITTNHPWNTYLEPNFSGGVPGVTTLELIEAGLHAHAGEGGTWGWITVGWHTGYVPPTPNPIGLIMKLKISANITGSPVDTSSGHIRLYLKDEFGVFVTFSIALSPGLDPGWVYLGDNGGEEQEIDLTTYGLSGSIVTVNMDAVFHANWTVDYVWRHIHFTN